MFYILIGGLLVALAISLVEFCFKSQKSPTTTSLTSNSMQMTDTMKPKSRLPITSARDYDNGQVNVYGVRMLLVTSGSCQKFYVIFSLIFVSFNPVLSTKSINGSSKPRGSSHQCPSANLMSQCVGVKESKLFHQLLRIKHIQR